jgi:hypothetical protein
MVPCRHIDLMQAPGGPVQGVLLATSQVVEMQRDRCGNAMVGRVALSVQPLDAGVRPMGMFIELHAEDGFSCRGTISIQRLFPLNAQTHGSLSQKGDGSTGDPALFPY